MAYCRFSSQDGRCDLYVYAHVDGFWVTDVAGVRQSTGAPAFAGAVFAEPAWKGRSTEEIDAEYRRRAALCDEWELANPLVPIDHPDAGQEFRDPTPGDCADRLERLGAAGFEFPRGVIEALREEQARIDAGAADEPDQDTCRPEISGKDF